jgi:hypothetical protein
MDGGNDSNQTALFRPIHAPEGGTISGSGGDSLELCDSLLPGGAAPFFENL